MEEILKEKYRFYNLVMTGFKGIMASFTTDKIKILDGFITRYPLVCKFYETFYQKDHSRVVLCGINPGRLGAGKTGIPFLDFKSISSLLSGIDETEEERSAQFIYEIISAIGGQRFFDHIYLTNISWFGFVKDGKNHNYYCLSKALQREFTQGFISEMKQVNPTLIIPLSQEVEATLLEMKAEGILSFDVAERLPHPNYLCFTSRKELGKRIYLERIQSYLD